MPGTKQILITAAIALTAVAVASRVGAIRGIVFNTSAPKAG